MERNEIYKKISEAKAALHSNVQYAAKAELVKNKQTHDDYIKKAKRIFGWENGKLKLPDNESEIIAKLQSHSTSNTLRNYARSVRYVSLQILKEWLSRLDQHQRKSEWDCIEKIVSSKKFNAIIALCKMMPADYKVGWKPKRKRKGKKGSFAHHKDDWRTEMGSHSRGQFRLPFLLTIATGARPSEFENGVDVWTNGINVHIKIRGAKVTEVSGQEEREFELPESEVRSLIIEELGKLDKIYVDHTVKVECGNSITTHSRAIAQKLWPKRKQSITSYSFRHAIAADCKAAMALDDAEPELVYKVLGHRVDITSSYYGARSQSKGISFAPRNAIASRKIEKKIRKPRLYKRLKKKI